MQGQPSHESIHSNMREKKLKKSLDDYQTSKNTTIEAISENTK